VAFKYAHIVDFILLVLLKHSLYRSRPTYIELRIPIQDYTILFGFLLLLFFWSQDYTIMSYIIPPKVGWENYLNF